MTARDTQLRFAMGIAGSRKVRSSLVLGLNHRLQKMGSKTTVVAFIIMPAATNSYTIEALKGQAVTQQLRETVAQVTARVGKRIFEHAARYSG